MRLYLINPSNSIVNNGKIGDSRWGRYRVWKPLGLMVLAGLTPPDWDISIFDENVGVPEYSSLPRPDLVGITAFTSQANRAYEVAGYFRRLGVPVVMGGIHATMRLDEAMEHVDSVVTGEAEGIWPRVLEDARHKGLKRQYHGGHANLAEMPAARHDLLDSGYAFGAIQTSRGCPLNCRFCSVSAFNGTRYRQRPVDQVVREFKMIPEKRVLVVDDNLIGTRTEHVARAKDLFRAMAEAGVKKKWIAQTTINFADDDELLRLASKAGCSGVFIGFESPVPDGLREIGKKFNLINSRDFRESVRRIKRYDIMVVGSFIIGLDIDEPGIGRNVALVADRYGVDSINVLFLTPLPGTRLWKKMESEGRIAMDSFPEDWKYYTLTYPVAQYNHLSLDDILREMITCNNTFYSMPRVIRRIWSRARHLHKPWLSIIGNFSSRGNIRRAQRWYQVYRRQVGDRFS